MDLFLEIMQQSAPVIENKLTDTNTNKRKNLEWQKIQSKCVSLTPYIKLFSIIYKEDDTDYKYIYYLYIPD